MANSFSSVYGQTFSRAPLATPSDESQTLTSIDQYSFSQPTEQRQQPASDSQQHKDSLCHSRPKHGRYVTEDQRKASFDGRWPHLPHVQNINSLVKYGFFYTGTTDLVRCYSCGIGLKDWSEVDDPLTEHVRYGPDCPVLVKAVPESHLARLRAATMPNKTVSTRESSASVLRPEWNEYSGSDEVILSVQPRSPQYRLKSVRISSFSKWSGGITQTAGELADAGFFYTGNLDRVRCYVCDGGLQKWNPDDNAWVEHARWFPHCEYVRQVKGAEFIELVQLSAEYQRMEKAETSPDATGKQSHTSSASGLSYPEKSEPVTIEELQDETEKLRSVIKCLWCKTNDANCLFLPCAHLKFCEECSVNVKICPICEKTIFDTVKTYMS